MPSVPPSLLETHEYTGPGFQPLIKTTAWRVAVMNFSPSDAIVEFQRHDETDEVFVLLQGRCILFLGEGREHITRIFAHDMQPLRLYNVKRGAWHTHVLTPDAKVLIVENQDTSPANSPRKQLTAEQRMEIAALTRQAWGEDIPPVRM